MIRVFVSFRLSCSAETLLKMIKSFWWALFYSYIVACQSTPLEKLFDNEEFVKVRDDNKTITDDTIRELFEKLKPAIGNEITIKEQKFSINSSTTEGDLNVAGNVSDVHFTDPSSYVVSEAHADMQTLTFQVVIKYKELNVIGNYALDAENELFHVIGSGKFSGNAKDISIEIGCKFNLTLEKTLQMEYFDLNYIVRNITMDFENLGGDKDVTEVLNAFINIAFPTIINVTKGDVQKVVNQTVRKYSAFLFTGMTVDQLVGYIYDIINM